MHRALLTLLVLAWAPLPASAQGTASPDPSVIVVHGEAALKRAPGRAFLTISTEVRDGKAANARRKSAEGMTEIRATLGALQLPADAVRTSGFSLQPMFDYRRSVRDYIVVHQIEVRIDNLDQLADVVDAANTPKGVAITIGSPRYELPDREAAENEAVRAAVQNAMARAKAIASGSGQTLGPILRIQQGSVGISVQPPPVFRAQPGSFGMSDLAGRGGGGGGGGTVPETPLTPGEIEIRATVTVTIRLG